MKVDEKEGRVGSAARKQVVDEESEIDAEGEASNDGVRVNEKRARSSVDAGVVF